jgi:hypothetical protein
MGRLPDLAEGRLAPKLAIRAAPHVLHPLQRYYLSLSRLLDSIGCSDPGVFPNVLREDNCLRDRAVHAQ